MIGAHEVKNIIAKCAPCLICQKKVTRFGSCGGCENIKHTGADMSLLTASWYCERRSAAMIR